MNPTPTNPITLVDPETSQLVGLDNPAQLPSLLDMGYRPASPQEVQAHDLRQHYDTLGQTAGAFGEGALETLVPIIGPALERALGVSTQDQALRAQFHPIAKGLGAAGGAIGGAIAGVGAPGLIAKLGAGAATAVGGGVLGGAVAGALEGGLYSASNVANRAVMQDPGLTAESALREIGMSAAFGGGIGALGALGKKFVADHAEQWSGDLQDFAADRTMKSLGGIQSDRAQLVKKYGEAGYLQMMREISEHPAKPIGPFSTPQSSYEVGGKMMDSAWKSMQDEMTKAGKAGATVSGDDLLARFQGVVGEMQGNPWAQSAIRKLQEPLDVYKTMVGGKDLPLETVHALRRQISDQIGYARGAVDLESNLSKAAMHEFRGAMSDSMEDALGKSGVGSAAWKAANRQYQLGSTVQKLAQRGINRAEGNNIVSPTEFLAGLASGAFGAGGEGGAGEGGGLIAQALGRGLIGTAATALVRRQGSHVLAWAGIRASNAIEAMAHGAEGDVGQAVERAFSGAAGIGSVKAADYLFTPSNFQERAAKINQSLANPDQIGFADPTLNTFMLPVMNQMRARIQSATGTLGSKIPKYDVVGPLDPVYQPSQTELTKLNRTAEIVHDPIAALAHVADGTLLPDHVATLDAVWPAYGQTIRQKVLDKLTSEIAAGNSISPRLRYSLSLLLGQDLSRASSGPAIAAAQAAYAARAPSAQGAPPPPGSRAESRIRNVQTKLGSRLATSNDSAIEHLTRPS